jgi:hypothetical protein
MPGLIHHIRGEERAYAMKTTRLRATWSAGLGGFLLVAALTGIAAGATTRSDLSLTSVAFVDTNGDGISDTCQAPVTADPAAAAAADAAVDLNHDGVISVDEAARSGRIGGVNCNHGGYVSWVAHGCAAAAATATPTETPAPTETATPEPTETATPAPTETPVPTATPTEARAEAGTSDCTTTTTEAAAPTTPCATIAPPTHDPALDLLPNGHGKWVSLVARSDAIGGKNCNHGGAVSEAAKKDHAAAKDARDAAKAARAAARAEARAARAAAKAAKTHGKPH